MFTTLNNPGYKKQTNLSLSFHDLFIHDSRMGSVLIGFLTIWTTKIQQFDVEAFFTLLEFNGPDQLDENERSEDHRDKNFHQKSLRVATPT